MQRLQDRGHGLPFQRALKREKRRPIQRGDHEQLIHRERREKRARRLQRLDERHAADEARIAVPARLREERAERVHDAVLAPEPDPVPVPVPVPRAWLRRAAVEARRDPRVDGVDARRRQRRRRRAHLREALGQRAQGELQWRGEHEVGPVVGVEDVEPVRLEEAAVARGEDHRARDGVEIAVSDELPTPRLLREHGSSRRRRRPRTPRVRVRVRVRAVVDAPVRRARAADEARGVVVHARRRVDRHRRRVILRTLLRARDDAAAERAERAQRRDRARASQLQLEPVRDPARFLRARHDAVVRLLREGRERVRELASLLLQSQARLLAHERPLRDLPGRLRDRGATERGEEQTPARRGRRRRRRRRSSSRVARPPWRRSL
mmetsp:Transcript_6019/g.21974  ORF Transcript_6019/g.21974 Transcript_6019/m.21974 type:complete len:380 (+) Transcript_6019:2477-3616(+)